MIHTSLSKFIAYSINNISYLLNKQLTVLSIGILNMLLGFFISTALSTIPGQTGDWGVIAAAVIVTFYELMSKSIYRINYKARKKFMLSKHINNIKIGILYGLFVDAFKLGS